MLFFYKLRSLTRIVAIIAICRVKKIELPRFVCHKIRKFDHSTTKLQYCPHLYSCKCVLTSQPSRRKKGTPQIEATLFILKHRTYYRRTLRGSIMRSGDKISSSCSLVSHFFSSTRSYTLAFFSRASLATIVDFS